MNIHILFDSYYTCKNIAPNFFHVENNKDYLLATEKADNALIENYELSIIVHNKAMYHWFDHYKKRRGVEIIHCDPCEILAKNLNVDRKDLPNEIKQDPKFISDFLLNNSLMKQRRKEDDVLSWILSVTLSENWIPLELNEPIQILNLIVELTSIKSSSIIDPTIIALRNLRVQHWYQSSKYSKLIKWIFDSSRPQYQAECILICRLIWNYPSEIRIKALLYEGRWSSLSQLEDLEGIMELLPINMFKDIYLPGVVSHIISDYLEHELKLNNSNKIINVINGYLPEEEKAVRTYLESNLYLIDSTWNEFLYQLEKIFSQSGRFKAFLKQIKSYYHISVPSKLISNEKWENVIHWLENEYFPFFEWCSTVGKLEKTSCNIKDFEDWLISNYNSISICSISSGKLHFPLT